MGGTQRDDHVGLAIPDEPEDEGAMLFVANVGRLRLHRGWSEVELARRAGLESAELARHLDGRSLPPLEIAWKIANALRVTLTTLLHPLRRGL